MQTLALNIHRANDLSYFFNRSQLWGTIQHYWGTFNNFGEPFHNFRDLSHNFGELFNIIGELLTNCVLAILKDLVNFGEFFVILLHLD